MKTSMRSLMATVAALQLALAVPCAAQAPAGPQFPAQISGLSRVTIPGLNQQPAHATVPPPGGFLVHHWANTVAPAPGAAVKRTAVPPGLTYLLDSRYTGAGYAWTLEYHFQWQRTTDTCDTSRPLNGICIANCCREAAPNMDVVCLDGDYRQRSLGNGIEAGFDGRGPGLWQPAHGGLNPNGFFAAAMTGDDAANIACSSNTGSLYQNPFTEPNGCPHSFPAADGFYTFMGDDHALVRPTGVRFTGYKESPYAFDVKAYVQPVPRLNMGGSAPDQATVVDLGPANQVTWMAGNLLDETRPQRFMAFHMQPGAELHLKTIADTGQVDPGKPKSLLLQLYDEGLKFYPWNRTNEDERASLETPWAIVAGPPNAGDHWDIKVYPPDNTQLKYPMPVLEKPEFIVVGMFPEAKTSVAVAARWGWYWTPAASAAVAPNPNPSAAPATFSPPYTCTDDRVFRYSYPADSCTQNPVLVDLRPASASDVTTPSVVRLQLRYQSAGNQALKVRVLDGNRCQMPCLESGSQNRAPDNVPAFGGVATYFFEASGITEMQSAPAELEIMRDPAFLRQPSTLTVEQTRFTPVNPSVSPGPLTAPACAIQPVTADGVLPAGLHQLQLMVTAEGPSPATSVAISVTNAGVTSTVAVVSSPVTTYVFPFPPRPCSVEIGRRAPGFPFGLDLTDDSEFPPGRKFTVSAQALFPEGPKDATPVEFRIGVPQSVKILAPAGPLFEDPNLPVTIEVRGDPGVESVTARITNPSNSQFVEITKAVASADPLVYTTTTVNLKITEPWKFAQRSMVTLTARANFKGGGTKSATPRSGVIHVVGKQLIFAITQPGPGDEAATSIYARAEGFPGVTSLNISVGPDEQPYALPAPRIDSVERRLIFDVSDPQRFPPGTTQTARAVATYADGSTLVQTRSLKIDDMVFPTAKLSLLTSPTFKQTKYEAGATFYKGTIRYKTATYIEVEVAPGHTLRYLTRRLPNGLYVTHLPIYPAKLKPGVKPRLNLNPGLAPRGTQFEIVVTEYGPRVGTQPLPVVARRVLVLTVQ